MFLNRLHKDLEYNYQGVELGEGYEDGQGSEPRTFQVTCRIEGSLGIDKVGKIVKCNNLFNVDVLKWIVA